MKLQDTVYARQFKLFILRGLSDIPRKKSFFQITDVIRKPEQIANNIFDQLTLGCNDCQIGQVVKKLYTLVVNNVI